MNKGSLTQKEFDQMGLETIISFDEDLPTFLYPKQKCSPYNGRKLKNETDSPIN